MADEMPKMLGEKEESPVEIKVMPEEFYFKKVKIKPPEAGEGGEKKGPKMALIVIVVLVVIGLMAGAAYLFTKSLTKKPTAEPKTNTNVAANVPANVPPVNVPVNAPPVNTNTAPAPLCGNGICETGENSATCPEDCPAPPPPTPPSELPSGPDIDQDGLTGSEELLYTTDAEKADTDGDGYSDGLELVNLYNPTGFAPQKIEETSLVKVYSNQTFGYSIFYPTTWLPRALDESNREIMFTSLTGEFIQVIVEDNPNKLALLEWYLSEAPGTNPADIGTAATKGGLLGIKSPDGLTVYFGGNDKIYAISYNVGIKTELNYKSTFEMMIKSFKLGM
jgi:hypothetical protein